MVSVSERQCKLKRMVVWRQTPGIWMTGQPTKRVERGKTKGRKDEGRWGEDKVLGDLCGSVRHLYSRLSRVLRACIFFDTELSKIGRQGRRCCSHESQSKSVVTQQRAATRSAIHPIRQAPDSVQAQSVAFAFSSKSRRPESGCTTGTKQFTHVSHIGTGWQTVAALGGDSEDCYDAGFMLNGRDGRKRRHA